ncbi:unnamed protein product [Diamesa serratosioi]
MDNKENKSQDEIEFEARMNEFERMFYMVKKEMEGLEKEYDNNLDEKTNNPYLDFIFDHREIIRKAKRQKQHGRIWKMIKSSRSLSNAHQRL